MARRGDSMRDADYGTVTLVKRLRCFVTGHDVRSWGSVLGHCHRCKHSVDNHGHRRAVLYAGRYHVFPPARKEG